MPVVIYDQSIGGSVTKFKGASVLGLSLAGAVGWKVEMHVVIYEQNLKDVFNVSPKTLPQNLPLGLSL